MKENNDGSVYAASKKEIPVRRVFSEASLRLRLGSFAINTIICIVGYIIFTLIFDLITTRIVYSSLAACGGQECVDNYYNSFLGKLIIYLANYLPFLYCFIYFLLQRLLCGHWLSSSLGKKIFNLEFAGGATGKSIGRLKLTLRTLVPLLIFGEESLVYLEVDNFQQKQLIRPILSTLMLVFNYNEIALFYSGCVFGCFYLIATAIDALFLLKDERCLHDYIAGTKVVRVK